MSRPGPCDTPKGRATFYFVQQPLECIIPVRVDGDEQLHKAFVALRRSSPQTEESLEALWEMMTDGPWETPARAWVRETEAVST